jgi:hypothetical protein
MAMKGMGNTENQRMSKLKQLVVQGKTMSLRDGWSRQQWDGVKMDHQELESFFGLSRDHF